MSAEVAVPAPEEVGAPTDVRRWKRYSAYRDPGVPWLRQVPEHWQVKRLKSSVRGLVAGGTPDTNNEANWSNSDLDIAWVAISDMTKSPVVKSTEKRVTRLGVQEKRLPVSVQAHQTAA